MNIQDSSTLWEDLWARWRKAPIKRISAEQSFVWLQRPTLYTVDNCPADLRLKEGELGYDTEEDRRICIIRPRPKASA